MASLVHTVAALSLALGAGGVYVAQSLDDWSRRADAAPPAARTQPPADQRQPAANRAMPSSEPSRHTGFGAVTIEQGRGGHFFVDAEVHGRRIPMLVDTGASVIALTAEDARAAGLYLLPSDFTGRVSTANGVTSAAPVTLREVRIRGITVRDVRAMVMQPGVMEQSLLGMSFLGRLGGYEVAQGRLVLRP